MRKQMKEQTNEGERKAETRESTQLRHTASVDEAFPSLIPSFLPSPYSTCSLLII